MTKTVSLTEYQKAQLLYLHFMGDFKYRNAKGNKVSRSAWRKMINALLAANLIDNHARITARGKTYLDKNHLNIDLSVLD